MIRKFYFFISLFPLILFLGACQKDSKNPISDYKYVGSVNSNIFHKPDCRWAKQINSSNLITFEDVEDAESSGYRPCKICKPTNLKKDLKKTFKKPLKKSLKKPLEKTLKKSLKKNLKKSLKKKL